MGKSKGTMEVNIIIILKKIEEDNSSSLFFIFIKVYIEDNKAIKNKNDTKII